MSLLIWCRFNLHIVKQTERLNQATKSATNGIYSVCSFKISKQHFVRQPEANIDFCWCDAHKEKISSSSQLGWLGWKFFCLHAWVFIWFFTSVFLWYYCSSLSIQLDPKPICKDSTISIRISYIMNISNIDNVCIYTNYHNIEATIDDSTVTMCFVDISMWWFVRIIHTPTHQLANFRSFNQTWKYICTCISTNGKDWDRWKMGIWC